MRLCFSKTLVYLDHSKGCDEGQQGITAQILLSMHSKLNELKIQLSNQKELLSSAGNV